MNNNVIFLVFVAVAELIFVIQHNYQAAITLLILSMIFGVLFFLPYYGKSIKSIILSFSERWKPPHQRVKEVVVGNKKTPNNPVIRVEKKDSKISINQNNRINSGDNNIIKDNPSYIVKIPDTID